MNNKKIIISILSLLLLFITVVFIKLFLIGSIANCNSYHINEFSIQDDTLLVYLQNLDSALVTKKYRYNIENDIVYIRIYKGLRINKKEQGDIKIKIPIENIKKVTIQDKNQEKIIWESNVYIK